MPTLAKHDSFHYSMAPALAKYNNLNDSIVFHSRIMPMRYSIVPTFAKYDGFHYATVPTLAI